METPNPAIIIERDLALDAGPGLATRIANVFRSRNTKATEVRTDTIVEIPKSFKQMVYEFLHVCFCLPEEQIPYDVVEAVYSISNRIEPSAEDIKTVITEDSPQIKEMLCKGVQCYLSGTIDLGKNELERIVEDLRRQISVLPANAGIDIKKLLEINSTVRRRAEAVIARGDYEMIHSDRVEAVSEIERYFPEIFKKWCENPYALADETMERFFVRNDHLMEGVDDLGNRFLTTYCDTAQFGLKNQILTDEAIALSHRKMGFMDFLNDTKEAILRHFEPKIYPNLRSHLLRRHEPLKFTRPSENLFTTINGTKAFELFCESYIKEGDVILATPQEYGEIVEMLEKKNVRVIQMPEYQEGRNEQKYEDQIASLLKKNRINHILVSDVSRNGTAFPFPVLHRILDRNPDKPNLIVDGVQSVGRRVIDFNAIKPSVFIGSIQKGSNIGGGTLGMLILSDDFIKKNGLDPKCVEKGTVGPEDLTRLRVACCPESLGSDLKGILDVEALKKMTISTREREAVTIELAKNFAELIRAINKKHGERIKIVYPKNLYCDDGTVRKESLSCIFTCKIDGIDRQTVRKVAEGYGVTINDYFDEVEPGVSFRIAFHPYMDNKALKIIGYALMECLGLK